MTEEKKKQGFAAMDPKRVSEIARLGGRAAHASGTAHEFTPEEARIAGAKGGAKAAKDRERMREIGRKGGLVSTRRPSTEAEPAPDVEPVGE